MTNPPPRHSILKFRLPRYFLAPALGDAVVGPPGAGAEKAHLGLQGVLVAAAPALRALRGKDLRKPLAADGVPQVAAKINGDRHGPCPPGNDGFTRSSTDISQAPRDSRHRRGLPQGPPRDLLTAATKAAMTSRGTPARRARRRTRGSDADTGSIVAPSRTSADGFHPSSRSAETSRTPASLGSAAMLGLLHAALPVAERRAPDTHQPRQLVLGQPLLLPDPAQDIAEVPHGVSCPVPPTEAPPL